MRPVSGLVLTGVLTLAAWTLSAQTTYDLHGDPDTGALRVVTVPSTRGQCRQCHAAHEDSPNAPVFPIILFTDNGNGTLTDNLTGLVWLQNANCNGYTSWADALTWANTLASGDCGLADGSVAGDWRVPNILELESLFNVDHNNESCGGSPCATPMAWLAAQGFTNTGLGASISSTTSTQNPSRAWGIGMSYSGELGNVDKSSTSNVLAVRGTSTGPAGVWRTGPTACDDTGGTLVACAGTGQDGAPDPAYPVNGEAADFSYDSDEGLLWYIYDPRGTASNLSNGVKLVLFRCKGSVWEPCEYWHGACGERFDGPGGWVAAADGYAGPDASSPALLREYKSVLADYTARTQRPLDHVRDFLDCIKSRRPTVANPEVMYQSMSICLAADVCGQREPAVTTVSFRYQM